MIETIIQRLLTAQPALAGGQVYTDVVPDPVQSPYITHHYLGGELGMTFRGPDGSEAGSVQIDCWAESAGEATTLALQVYKRLSEQNTDFAASSIRRLPSAYDLNTKLHRVSWEVAITIAIAIDQEEQS